MGLQLGRDGDESNGSGRGNKWGNVCHAPLGKRA